MTTKRVKQIAAEFGATVDDKSLQSNRLVVDTPIGKVWAANGCHALVADFSRGDTRTACNDILDRMGYGVTLCEDAECDICQPVEAGR